MSLTKVVATRLYRTSRRGDSLRRTFVLHRLMMALLIMGVALPGFQQLGNTSLAASPELTLSPGTGEIGERVTLRGKNFPSRTEGQVLWDGDEEVLATFTTSRSGAFSERFRIPKGAKGTIIIAAEAGEVRVETKLVVKETETIAQTPEPTNKPATQTPEPATQTPLPTETPKPTIEQPSPTKESENPTRTATGSSDPAATTVPSGEAPQTTDPQGVNSVAVGGGLTGQYFDNQDLTNPKFTRVDPVIDFDWGSGSPDPAIGSDSFSVRWTGQVLADYTEKYTFCVTSNDGARLRVNNTLLVNQWKNQAATEHCGSIALTAGTWYPITLEYYEGVKTAIVRLTYASSRTSKRVIPSDHLAADGSVPNTTPVATATPTATATPKATATPTTTPPTNCSTTIQKLVDAAPSGSVVKVPPCIYREQVTITKPLTLDGQQQAEIRGSDVWTEWTQSGAVWISKKTVPSFTSGGSCREGSRCKWPEQVFLNGTALIQVQGTPSKGQFAIDGSRRVVLADSPAGRTVEVTTRTFWLKGAGSHVGGVTIKGFKMTHAGNYRSGALNTSLGSRWTIEWNELSWAHAWNLEVKGRDSRIVGNNVHHAGSTGVAPGGDNLYLAYNEIHHNNTEMFNTGEGGGVKAVDSDVATWEYNEVYANDGTGLWCDIGCSAVTIRYNRVHHNMRNGGIFYEISDGAKIYGNTVWENNWGYTSGGAGGGIILGNTRNSEVYDNVVAWNADGITVLSYNRGDATWNSVTGNSVHNNTIVMDGRVSNYTGLGWFQNWSGVMCSSSSNNKGADNAYWFSKPEPSTDRFQWCGAKSTLSSFNSTPGEERGRYLSTSERDQILNKASVPTSPGT